LLKENLHNDEGFLYFYEVRILPTKECIS